jgi:2-methylcitrate dehydratase PrpD
MLAAADSNATRQARLQAVRDAHALGLEMGAEVAKSCLKPAKSGRRVRCEGCSEACPGVAAKEIDDDALDQALQLARNDATNLMLTEVAR